MRKMLERHGVFHVKKCKGYCNQPISTGPCDNLKWDKKIKQLELVHPENTNWCYKCWEIKKRFNNK